MLLSLALLGGLSVAAIAAWAFVQGVRGVAPAQTGPSLPTTVAISLVATAISALIVYYFRRSANAVERRESWRALWRPSSWAWVALSVFVCTGYSALIHTFAQGANIDLTPTNQVFAQIVADHPIVVVAFAVLIAPAYEELLFRRVLFGRLWAAGRPWLGLALSSLAFAWVHEPPGLGATQGWGMVLLWSVYAAMGASFAWIYRRTGSLWTAYLAHAGNNLIACLALLAGP
ncbi:CPBP family intramembrane glutamic endopeptidase [Lysobacter sp. CA199]|uniref:CPBP family intramembrane glutamic endopeptidase n=1 Tax=Lysobacter sp. CA199 TaxID=3455608 RepID=UPI003F8CF32D